MTNVFIGGSRKLSHLSQPVLQRLENIISNSFTVLVGDASGADLQVQKYLFAQKYNNVIVFCSGDNYRNNVGRWETRIVLTDQYRKGFNFYTAKDLQMAKEAAYGFMIWDAKSKGTLNNALNLLRLEKSTLVFFAPTRAFQTVRTPDDLRELLAMCDQTDVAMFEKELSLQQFFTAVRPQLSFNLPEPNVDPETAIAV